MRDEQRLGELLIRDTQRLRAAVRAGCWQRRGVLRNGAGCHWVLRSGARARAIALGGDDCGRLRVRVFLAPPPTRVWPGTGGPVLPGRTATRVCEDMPFYSCWLSEVKRLEK